jgi:hypothetical protein
MVVWGLWLLSTADLVLLVELVMVLLVASNCCLLAHLCSVLV